ncbi:MAG: glutathione peroxidase [Chitinophagaceae bacterium]|nr:MAG: glutathione peroxidase [Chitinophagaceae bacterium]
MTLRQRILKTLYPAYISLNRLFGRHQVILRNPGTAPARSFYEHTLLLGNGAELRMEDFKGRKVLLVNTASDCIYTDQYKQLQELMAHYGNGLVVLAFPSNDFKEQERGGDKEILDFCAVNYGVSFPVAHKAQVVCGPAQQPVFRWLTDRKLNGWNSKAPSWNFSKYLVNEQGVLTHYFDPAITPAHHELVKALYHG